MSHEQRTLLADTLQRLFADHAQPQSAVSEGWNTALWRQLDEMGLPLLMVAEAQEGYGGSWDDAFVVAQALGSHAVALPLAETVMARALAVRHGLPAGPGPLGLASAASGSLDRAGRFTGTLHGVPWGRHLEQVLAVIDQDGAHHLLMLPRAEATLREGHNPAGEPRDRLGFDGADARVVRCDAALGRELLYHGALWRVGQIAGALEALLARSVTHVRERVQFGKPIASFQAVQQQMAVFGAEVAAVGCAARAACRSATVGEARFEIAAAKLRANLAIDCANAVAHQVHGAIGFTREHDLRHFTQRLLAWRSEFGNDRHWSEALGQAVISRGVDTFWADLTARGDAAAMASAADEPAGAAVDTVVANPEKERAR
ncbi:acyl-CoA dehydrogenase family protein [Aquabacterium sp.]|uniref:acyl-CoA dehydrogenase family protein n=1 Tax=Aquabacterium sp. TaxID=1872578 RepID=UPI002C0D7B70|nr:acyl-CoA dehydrogenase family protein [Aquabacterium sp.]HSW06036.1 acyl-CoA dehydrogenase family protein [Aquabacterium sp.]